MARDSVRTPSHIHHISHSCAGRKCAALSQRQYELLPFAVETSGGFAPSAVKLMQAMALASAQTMLLWSRTILQQLVGSVAIAVQRGNRCRGWRGTTAACGGMSRVCKCRVEVMDGEDEDE